MYAIDYAHEERGVFYHGTVSDLDGEPKVTWTITQGGQKARREGPLSPAALAFLTSGLDTARVIHEHAATGDDQEIDPAAQHVIGYLQDDGEHQARQIFLVPAGERRTDFLRWLAALAVPGTPPPLQLPPAAQQVAAKVGQFLDASLDRVNIPALVASGDRRVVLLLFAYGAVKAYEKSASLDRPQVDAAFLRVIEQTLGWFLESEGPIVALMHSTLTPAGDAELREIMQHGKKALTAWHANPTGDHTQSLGALLDEYVEA